MESMTASFAGWLGFVPNIAAILIIGTVCEMIKRLVLGSKASRTANHTKGWRRVYLATYRGQALLLGALLGLIPGIPVPPDFRSDGVCGAVLNYAGDGAAAMVMYAVIVSTVKSYISQLKNKKKDPA